MACCRWMDDREIMGNPKANTTIKEQLDREGQFIVDKMNESQDRFHFTYVELD